MGFIQKFRQAWDELFTSKLVLQQREEIAYLRGEIATLRIDRQLLQSMLNDVNVAGQVLYRRENPPRRPDIPVIPGPKRWSEVVAERDQEILVNRQKAKEEKERKAQAV